MYQAILLLVATLFSISSHSQRVTENLVQELYYVDGENVMVTNFDEKSKTNFSICLTEILLPKHTFNESIQFSILSGNRYQHLNFKCKLVENSLLKKNPLVTCSDLENAVEIFDVTKDTVANTELGNISMYEIKSDSNVLFLNKLLETPKKQRRQLNINFRKEIEVSKNLTITKSYSEDMLSSQTVVENLPNGDKKEYFKWMTNGKKKMKPYSSVKLINYRGDSTITFVTNRLSHFNKDAKRYEKIVLVKGSSGNLLFEGRYIGNKRSRSKELDYSLRYEIEYKYFGETLERRIIKEPTGMTLVEIRRKYAD